MRRFVPRLILSLAISSCFIAGATLSWFNNQVTIDGNGVIGGSSIGGYFGGGDGSADAPYKIMNGTHLYNLAWLQDLGAFNKDTDEDGNIDKQYHFIVSNDVNLGGLVIPPIGTYEYPFLGEFNGNNKTISNFTITNKLGGDDGINRKPSSISSLDDVEIVGFFGVVGQIKDADVSYSSSANQVINVTLNNFTVSTVTTKSLIGLAAGYVNGKLEGVKVNNASLSVAGATPIATYTDKLSDYGLVGYCKDEYLATNGSYNQELSKLYDSDFDDSQAGVNWGGSVAIRDFTMFIYTQFLDPNAPNNKEKSVDGFRFRTNIVKTSSSNNYSLSITPLGYPGTYPVHTAIANKSPYNYTTYMNPDSFNVPLDGSNAPTANTQAISYCLKDGGYIPLRFEEEGYLNWNNTFNGNSGYFVGGGAVNNYNDQYITFSSNYFGKIGNSMSNTAIGYNSAGSKFDQQYKDNQQLEIVTYSPNDNGWALIEDKYNTGHTSTNPRMSSLTKRNYKTYFNFQKYEKARDQFHNSLMATSRVNGLQFLKSTNDNVKPDILTVPSGVEIFGENKTNYQLPKGYVDFNVKKRGYITLFAGTYAAANQKTELSFFSLYKVNRSGSTFNSMTRISKIYNNTQWSEGSSNPRYVYEYVDGTTSTGTKSASPIFDMSKTFEASIPCNSGSDSKNNMIFYFEVPVEAGEYTIGLTPNTQQGSSLLYLDIGTNGDEDNERVKAYSITTNKEASTSPKGVDFASVSTGNNGGESLCVSIASGKNGTITFAASNKELSITNGSLAVITYYGTRYIDNSSPPDGRFHLTGDSPTDEELTKVSYKSRTIYIDSTNPFGAKNNIKIVDSFDSSGTYTTSTYYIDDTVSTVADITSANPLITSDVIASMRTLELAVKLTRNDSSSIEFNAQPTYSETVEDESLAAVDIDVALDATGVEVLFTDIASSYSVHVESTVITEGSTHTF